MQQPLLEGYVDSKSKSYRAPESQEHLACRIGLAHFNHFICLATDDNCMLTEDRELGTKYGNS
jgi:hypothetical protein